MSLEVLTVLIEYSRSKSGFICVMYLAYNVSKVFHLLTIITVARTAPEYKVISTGFHEACLLKKQSMQRPRAFLQTVLYIVK